MGYRHPLEDSGDTTPRLPAELAGQPGTRAPHAQISAARRQLSTSTCTVPAWSCWPGQPGTAGSPPPRSWTYRSTATRPAPRPPRRTASEDGASLVRPDGFVAWRSQSGVPDPLAALGAAVDTALRRRPRALASPAGSA
jgi:putative polyketide hydroxylase